MRCCTADGGAGPPESPSGGRLQTTTAALADDCPQVPPPGALSRQTDHQLDRRLQQATPGVSGRRVGPAPGDQLPMPAQERRGRYQGHLPAFAGQQPGQRRQDHSVGHRVPRSVHLTRGYGPAPPVDAAGRRSPRPSHRVPDPTHKLQQPSNDYEAQRPHHHTSDHPRPTSPQVTAQDRKVAPFTLVAQ
jgi:hypothetical protein